MELVCTRCAQVCAEPGAHFCPSCGGRLEPREAADPAASSTRVPAPPADPQMGGELAGARCAAHPDVPARNVCNRCGNFACAACVRRDEAGQPLCAGCAERVQPGVWRVPWERRAELGLVQAYWQTAKASAFEPQKAFAGLAPTGKWWDAMSYALASSCLAMSGTVLFYGVITLITLFSSSQALSAGHGVSTGIAVLLIAAVIPIFVIGRVYVGAGIDHLMLLMLGGGRAGFDATFRAYCYCMSPGIFGFIPVCSQYVYEIWRMVLTILAYKDVHKMSGGRAAAAVLIPIGVCCGSYLGLLGFAGIFARH